MEQAEKRPAGSPPSWQWIVIGAAVILSVAVAIVAFRSFGSHAEASNEAVPVLVAPKEPALPPAVSIAAPAADPPAVDPPTPDPTAAPLQVDATKPADPAADLAKKPVVRTPPPPQAPAPRPKPAPTGGLTDFGGRR